MEVSLGSVSWEVPVISRCVDFLRIFAPSCSQAWIIASESGEARALCIMEVPCATEAQKIARRV